MRCMACGAEMILMNVVQDDTMAVQGFEHHTFMCSACGEVEQRLAFNRPVDQSDLEGAPAHAAPPLSPAIAEQREHAAAPGVLRRVLAKLRTASARPA